MTLLVSDRRELQMHARFSPTGRRPPAWLSTIPLCERNSFSFLVDTPATMSSVSRCAHPFAVRPDQVTPIVKD